MIDCTDIMDARRNNKHIQYIHMIHFKTENDLISCTHSDQVFPTVNFLMGKNIYTKTLIKTVRKNNQALC